MITQAYALNPYVGPRPYQRGETLYGRDRERFDVLDLLIAERIVLLYSPSGAGKTSFIQAGLLPKLEEENFYAFPVIRVGLPVPPEQAQELPSEYNRYVLSALLSLEEDVPNDKQLPVAELAGLTLKTYVERRSRLRAFSRKSPLPSQESGTESEFYRILIFDQFEEILTVDPTDWLQKTEFFVQLGEVLRDNAIYALLAMREDFSAGLDPYAREIPTRLRTTFRLDLLDAEAAAQAMQGPAAQAGIPFAGNAVTMLINDLRTVRVQQLDGSVAECPGVYVEPVQLQVVCRRLWHRMPKGATAIAEAHIQEAGDVDTALAEYYADCVQAVAKQTGVPERKIRNWFHARLITEHGIRGQVLKDVGASQGLDNQAIDLLVDAHLVRAEERRGTTWYELAHDRLIEPVRRNNTHWFPTHLSPLQHQAVLWDAQKRPKGLLFRDDELHSLKNAEAWAAEHQDELLPVERDFLTACRNARRRKKGDRPRKPDSGDSNRSGETPLSFYIFLGCVVVVGTAISFALGRIAVFLIFCFGLAFLSIMTLALITISKSIHWGMSYRQARQWANALGSVLPADFRHAALEPEDLRAFHLMNTSTAHEIMNAFTGTRQQVACTIFVINNIMFRNEERQSTTTALYFQDTGRYIPNFFLRPRTPGEPPKSFFDNPVLSEKYVLLSLQEDADAVAHCFTPDVLRALETYKGNLWIESSHREMLFYEENRHIPHTSLLQYMDDMIKIFLLFNTRNRDEKSEV